MRDNLKIWTDVFDSAQLRDMAWEGWAQPGRAGADICRLYDDVNGPIRGEAFIVRFAPGAHGDMHEHRGFELMLVLDGELVIGEDGSYGPGALIVEEPHSVHRVSSTTGAVVLCVRHDAAVGLRDQSPDMQEVA